MKLATVDRQIDRISTKTERQFTIKATGKAFRILSSGLYKEKVLAVVRELSCNAYDAHVAAGYASRPFDIHLPSPFEPYFAVRDYGPALSPDQIETVFTTYFESTKTESNDQIGGLGLGCKSPLSYVDSFTVISRYEGLKRTYTVFFDETDTPSMVEMSCDEITDDKYEEGGLEVRLPVRNDSFYEFKDRAEKVFRYFNPKPNVVGNGEYKPQTPDVILQGPSYELVSGSQNARAIMGIVSYPIDGNSLNLSGPGRSLLTSAIDIRFEVGDLDIQAGREELSYDERTKKAITARVDSILTDLHTRVIRSVAKCKNEFEARRFYGSVVSRFQVIRSLFTDGKVPYRGGLIDAPSFALNLKDDFPLGTYLEYEFSGARPKYNTHTASSYRDMDRMRPRADNDLRMVIDDLNGRETSSRLRQYNDDNPSHKVWLVRAPADELAALQKKMTGVPFLKISDMPKSPVTPRAPTSVLQLGNFSRSRGGTIRRTDWNRATVEPDDGGVFVATVSGAVQDANGMTAHNFGHFYSKCLDLKLWTGTDELYSIPKSLMKNFEGADGWVNFFTLMKEKFVQRMEEEDWADSIAKQRAVTEFSQKYSTISGERDLMKEIATKLPASHPISEFCTLWEQCVTNRNFTAETEMAARFGVVIPSTTKKYDLCGAWSKINHRKNYPMLSYVLSMSSWTRRDYKAADETAAYVLLSDRNCIPVSA